MSRSGPRPHVWIVQGEIPHSQYLSWLQMRAQANFRKELFKLTFEEFQQLWIKDWCRKGRATDCFCLTRQDPDGAWSIDNVVCIPRLDHLRRQRLYKKERKNGKQINQIYT